MDKVIYVVFQRDDSEQRRMQMTCLRSSDGYHSVKSAPVHEESPFESKRSPENTTTCINYILAKVIGSRVETGTSSKRNLFDSVYRVYHSFMMCLKFQH